MSGIHTLKHKLTKIEKVQRRSARFVTNRFHNTSSVSSMISDLNWPLLEFRRTKARLIMFYKIVHCLVAIHPDPNLLLPNFSRTRQGKGSHLCTYRHISTSKDSYKYAFFPRTIIQWNLLPAAVYQAPTIESFKLMLTVPVLFESTRN